LDAVMGDGPAVVHLAGQPGVRGSFGETFPDYVSNNVVATQRVFEAALHAGVRRVVYASSSSVYGDAGVYPSSEANSATVPLSPYGVTKRSCEDLAAVYQRLGLRTVGLRYFTVYGPRQRPDMAIRRLCEAATGGPVFQLHGDGRQSRDLTYVGDAVDATFKAIVARDPGRILNIGGGHEVSMNEVIDQLSAIAGATVPVRESAGQRGDVRRTAADTTLARLHLGWQPRTPLGMGLRAEFDWVVEQATVEHDAGDLAVAAAS
jgi:nucleoside-diphosphate-sugar epimerase